MGALPKIKFIDVISREFTHTHTVQMGNKHKKIATLLRNRSKAN